jgi:primase-polymerase (primpol)-like protein
LTIPRKGYARLDVSQLANVPEMLKLGQRFVCWREGIRKGKLTKIPVTPRYGADAQSDNPMTWGEFSEAVAFYEAHRNTLAGIGRMFHPDDGIIGIDFDDCLDDHGNVIVSHVAATWLPRLNSYTEISPSGRGVKVWVKAAHDLGGKFGRTNRKLGVEIYRERRFFTITGRRMP